MRYDFKEGHYYSPVCDSYEVDADNLGVTFHITPNIKMNDGNTFGATDIVTSIKAFREHSGLGWQLDFVDLDNSKIIDDNTIDLRFTAVNGVFEAGFQMLTLVSGKAYDAASGDDSFYQAPVGPQAYDITEWVSGDHITATRFDGYYRGTPPIKTLTMKIISDRTAAFMALQNGDIDLLWNISADQAQTVSKSENLTQVMMGQNMMIYLGMNSGNKALSDFRVRQAISLAVNRQDIIDGAYSGLAYPANSLLTPEAIGYDANTSFPARDIEKAKALMKEAGYESGLTIRLLAESTINFQLVTEQLAAQLGEIGITLEPTLTDYATMQSILFSGDSSGYDLFLQICQDSDDAISTLDNPMLFGASHPELSADGSNTGWKALWDQIRLTPDIEGRIKLYNEVNTYFIEKGLYWVPLAVGQTYVAMNKDLTGFRRNGFMLYFEDAYFR
jgi:peptide/nickel transport system substrate-binding protein